MLAGLAGQLQQITTTLSQSSAAAVDVSDPAHDSAPVLWASADLPEPRVGTPECYDVGRRMSCHPFLTNYSFCFLCSPTPLPRRKQRWHLSKAICPAARLISPVCLLIFWQPPRDYSVLHPGFSLSTTNPGVPWFRLHNPHMDWSTGAIRGWSPSCRQRCLQQASLSLCPLHSSSVPDLIMVAPEYQNFFSKAMATSHPPLRPCD